MRRKYPRKKLIKLRKLQPYFFLSTHQYTINQVIMRTYPLTNDTFPLEHLPLVEDDLEILPPPSDGDAGFAYTPDLIWYPQFSPISIFTKRYACAMWAYQVRLHVATPEIWYNDFVPFNTSVYFKAIDLLPLRDQIFRSVSKEPPYKFLFSEVFWMQSGDFLDSKSYYLNQMSNMNSKNLLNPHSRDFLFLIPLTARLLSFLQT